ncbi:MAG: response regulator [Gammaproteobacteria bacterium]|nr:response regulator [Gammaproteobacteria bacterium]
MNLPDEISSYLKSVFEESRNPLCFLIDRDFALLDWWGFSEAYGYKNLQSGASILDHAPFLFGMLGSKTEVLPFVTTPTGGTVEVHILPHKRRFFVILLSATRDHDTHQQRQQTANELKLLHATQRQLITRQRTLIGELVEAKAELDHRRREAERSNANKNQFIAMMTHEFRTPLSSIINYADLALEADTSEADGRKSSEAIARASRHLLNLVETVLHEARLEAGHLKLRERSFNVQELLDDLSTILAPLAAEKGIAYATYLEDNVPAVLYADDVCLRQILINLLGNAIKFTETGGVSMEVAWSDSQLLIAVNDSGPGIDLADQERIFGAYQRAERADALSQPGSGLGLTITIELTRLMQGHFDLDSEPGRGCKASLRVPAKPSSMPSEDDVVLPAPAVELDAEGTATILLCDDDEDLIDLAEYYLQRAGYGLLVARDGEEAVEKALQYSPDLILMDINTPRLSGADAARQLREAGFSAPVVALTASDVRKLDQRDFTVSLRKPIQMPRLLAEIRRHLR